MRFAGFVAFILFLPLLGSAQKSYTYITHSLEPFPGPQAYRAVKSGTTLYVESDGRHVAAISSDGKLLWNRDPFADAHLEFYRTKIPQIIYIGPIMKWEKKEGLDSEKFVQIVFTSSQFGVLQISDGTFQFRGQD